MKKIIMSGALVLFIFTFSFKLFADWDAANAHRHALKVEGYHVEDVSTSYEPGQNLVPEGSVLTKGDVDRITYTYDVLTLPDQSVSPEFQSLVLETADGKVADDYDLFQIETEVLERKTVNSGAYDRLQIEANITLRSPETDEQGEFLGEIRRMAFDLHLTNDK
ncbi:MAG: hypothetical protein ACOC14_01065 [Bacillota bacterium]